MYCFSAVGMQAFHYYFDRAVKEAEIKSRHDMLIESALIWCGRACAAIKDGQTEDAALYAQEALNHAQLSGFQGLVAMILEAFRIYRVDHG